MTQEDTQDKGQAVGGDVSAESNLLSDAEANQIGSSGGAGARQEPGADASEEFIDEHVSGENAPGAKNSSISRESQD